MMSEPYKIKEVKKIAALRAYERWNILKQAHFNTFHVCSDHVSFDMVARGMSAWSHFQKAGLMIGDEAYAGARSFLRLESAVRDVLGIEDLVPTHNGIGSEKLLVATMLQPGQTVLHNRGRCEGLVPARKGKSVDVSVRAAGRYGEPEGFGGNIDVARLGRWLRRLGKGKVAYIEVDTCPDAWNGQPVSLANIKAVREMASACGVALVIDISDVLENAYWVRKVEAPKRGILDIAREIIGLADIVLMDASQDPRSDVGGFIASPHEDCFAKLRNEVTVYEGLHTYGGMSGRAMEVFAIGVEEMAKTEYTEWYQGQVEALYDMVRAEGVPAFKGTRGIALDVKRFLPHIPAAESPKFVLAASLYIQGGMRGKIEGLWEYHAKGEGARTLIFELPRCAYTINHLREIADVIAAVYQNREDLTGLSLKNDPEFVDEAQFEPLKQRLFVSFPRVERSEKRMYEPYKVAIFEPVRMVDKKYRRKAIVEAGYNTFLLKSEDVYLDFLTDSGTSAMSCYQWEGMTNTGDTPYSSRHYLKMVEEFREILGYNYIIPTHQGRAAEHIMSQCMIKPGQIVPGNMYFTTTKLHQEMAGGAFVDVIVDQAHDPTDPFPWKGNIDLEKLEGEIRRAGPENVAYVSFETCVNMAGGQPISMQNAKDVSKLLHKYGIPNMYDATRCVENAYMIKWKDPQYADKPVKEILRELLSYGDGCTISAKKDFLVNMGGLIACNSPDLNRAFLRMLRVWEGDVTNGGLDSKDIEALHRGLMDSLDDDYIKMRIAQTQEFGRKLQEAGVPIVVPPGSHAVFIDARRFLPHIDQEQYPAQALTAAMYIECGVRTMERGNVSKGRDPKTGKNYRPKLELVRCTIPRRVYTNSHIDYAVEGIAGLYRKRDRITGLRLAYEPRVLRFFQGRFEPLGKWDF